MEALHTWSPRGGGEAPSCHNPNTPEFLGLVGRSSGGGSAGLGQCHAPSAGMRARLFELGAGQGWAWAACPGFQSGSLCNPRDYVYAKTG